MGRSTLRKPNSNQKMPVPHQQISNIPHVQPRRRETPSLKGNKLKLRCLMFFPEISSKFSKFTVDGEVIGRPRWYVWVDDNRYSVYETVTNGEIVARFFSEGMMISLNRNKFIKGIQYTNNIMYIVLLAFRGDFHLIQEFIPEAEISLYKC